MIRLPFKLIAKNHSQTFLYPSKLKWNFATFKISKFNKYSTPCYVMDMINVENNICYYTDMHKKYEGCLLYDRNIWQIAIIDNNGTIVYVKNDQNFRNPIGDYDGVQVIEL